MMINHDKWNQGDYDYEVIRDPTLTPDVLILPLFACDKMSSSFLQCFTLQKVDGVLALEGLCLSQVL